MAQQRTLTQATRVVAAAGGGTETQYGWRPDTDTGWDPTAVIWTNTQSVPTGYVAWLVYESAFGTKKSAGFGRWAVCPTCLEEFPIAEMVKVRGKYYCTKYEDYLEQQ